MIPNLERRYRETDSAWSREELERYQNNRPCGVCDGYRLKPEALAVKIAGMHVGEVVRLSIREALAWIEDSAGLPYPPSATRSPAPSSRKSASGWASSSTSGSTT